MAMMRKVIGLAVAGAMLAASSTPALARPGDGWGHRGWGGGYHGYHGYHGYGGYRGYRGYHGHYYGGGGIGVGGGLLLGAIIGGGIVAIANADNRRTGYAQSDGGYVDTGPDASYDNAGPGPNAAYDGSGPGPDAGYDAAGPGPDGAYDSAGPGPDTSYDGGAPAPGTAYGNAGPDYNSPAPNRPAAGISRDGGNQDQAVDACAAAAERQAGGNAHVQDITSVARTTNGWDVYGMIGDDRDSGRFSCKSRFGAVADLRLDQGGVGPQ